LRQESGLFDLLVSGRPLAELCRSASTDGHDRPGLTVIPGDRRTATAQTVLASEGFRLTALSDALRPVLADVVIFDTSPSVGLLQEAALYAADWLIVPSAVDYAATEGLMAILATLKAQQERGAGCQLLGIVPTFFDEVTRESRATLGELRESFGAALWPPVHRATVLRECAAEGLTVFEKAPESRTAAEYADLAGRVLAHE
jgi:chromosome partitioning protein